MGKTIVANQALLKKLKESGKSEEDLRLFLWSRGNAVDLHPAIVNRPFTPNLPKGRTDSSFILTLDQMRHSIIQWLAFSNEFIEIEASHLVRAPTKVVRHAARNILVVELGVPLDVKTGEAEGHTFSHSLAHIEWVEEIAEMLGIDTTLLDYWDRADKKTQRFLTMLRESYGSRDWSLSAGASFAVETWAGYGIGEDEEMDSKNFWSEELVGLQLFNETHRVPNGLKPLPEKFFTYHKALERGHVANVEKEFADMFTQTWFNKQKWLEGAKHALDGVYLFFEGREDHRIGRV